MEAQGRTINAGLLGINKHANMFSCANNVIEELLRWS